MSDAPAEREGESALAKAAEPKGGAVGPSASLDPSSPTQESGRVSERPSFFVELKRRNVIRAAVLYLSAVWALAQGIAQLGPSLGMPEWGTRWFLVAACIGFPFWLAFAWFYEWTPEGFKREHEVEAHESITHHTGRKLDLAIIGVLAVAVVLLLTDRFVLRHGVNQAAAAPEHSIAVLPFVDMSPRKDQEYFSDGMSEELLNLLAKVPHLQVTARTSSFSFKGKNLEIPEIARQLHVAHVLEGSVRKSGNQLRITAQLIHAADGYHVWSETCDRRLDDVFAIQDEIAAKVVRELKVTLLGAAPMVRTTEPRGLRAVPAGKALGRQATRRSAREVRRSVRAGARDRSALRTGLGRAGSQLHEQGGHRACFRAGRAMPAPGRRRRRRWRSTRTMRRRIHGWAGSRW